MGETGYESSLPICGRDCRSPESDFHGSGLLLLLGERQCTMHGIPITILPHGKFSNLGLDMYLVKVIMRYGQEVPPWYIIGTSLSTRHLVLHFLFSSICVPEAYLCVAITRRSAKTLPVLYWRISRPRLSGPPILGRVLRLPDVVCTKDSGQLSIFQRHFKPSCF